MERRKKIFGDWKKLKISSHGARVATFYIPKYIIILIDNIIS